MAIEHPKCNNCGIELGGMIVRLSVSPMPLDLIDAGAIHAEEATSNEGLFCNPMCAGWFLIARVMEGTR